MLRKPIQHEEIPGFPRFRLSFSAFRAPDNDVEKKERQKEIEFSSPGKLGQDYAMIFYRKKSKAAMQKGCLRATRSLNPGFDVCLTVVLTDAFRHRMSSLTMNWTLQLGESYRFGPESKPNPGFTNI